MTILKGGRVYDPANGVHGEQRDIHIKDGKIARSGGGEEVQLRNHVVMAGGIDMHTHIGGGKVNIARLTLNGVRDAFDGDVLPHALETGARYAEIGYTACFEPAVIPSNARHAHMEMADVPFVDTGGYIMLGNSDALFELLASGAEPETVRDFVACMLDATQCIGIKVVNPGGIHAFKFNQRKLELDDDSGDYPVTPRDIIRALSAAIDDLGLAHPLHVHTSNLGVPGNYQTTIDTIAAAEGRRLHLTHIQFHSYGTEGDRRFSSAAAEIVEAVKSQPNITLDVGQIMFGQTVTASGDTMAQWNNSKHAHPHKSTVMDIECEAGCGVVPFRYSDKHFVHSLQWAIGLEIFLLMDDPWRVFLTTDHPNGAPFTSYPHLIRLLMDKSFRNDMLATIHPEAAAMSRLASIEREYTLDEIAIMTRAAPAKLLGLSDKGHLAAGADADIAVYEMHDNIETMFQYPLYVFKGGQQIVSGGRVLNATVETRTHTAKPEYDPSIKRWLAEHYAARRSIRFEDAVISGDEMRDLIGAQTVEYACKRKY